MHSTLLHLFRIDRYKFKHCLLPLNRRRMACLRYSVEGQGCLLLVFPRNGDERIFSPKQADSSNLTYRTWFKFLVSPTIFSRSSPLCSSLYSKNSVKYLLFEEKIFRAHFRVEYTLWDKLYESWTKYRRENGSNSPFTLSISCNFLAILCSNTLFAYALDAPPPPFPVHVTNGWYASP